MRSAAAATWSLADTPDPAGRSGSARWENAKRCVVDTKLSWLRLFVWNLRLIRLILLIRGIRRLQAEPFDRNDAAIGAAAADP